MKEKELKKWNEMKALGQKKFIIAEGFVSTGLLSGGILSYFLAVFLLKTSFFLVAAITIPLTSLIGIYAAKKKWKHMELREAYDKKQANEASEEKIDDLYFLDADEEKDFE
jgi:hypothetical protein